MIRLGDLIKLAETYGEDAEVYIEINENGKQHLKESDDAEIHEVCHPTLTSIKNFETWNGQEGIVLQLPTWQKHL